MVLSALGEIVIPGVAPEAQGGAALFIAALGFVIGLLLLRSAVYGGVLKALRQHAKEQASLRNRHGG